MSQLILHRAIGSPPARAVMMLAELLDVSLQTRDVDITRLEHKTPQFLKLNPMGTVLVLQDGDFVLSESHAIMKYLLATRGGARGEALYPAAARARALVDQALFFNCGSFFPALRAVGLAAILEDATEVSDMHKFAIESGYGVVDAYLAGRPYVAAAHLTVADLSVGATATALQTLHSIDRDSYPRCSDWVRRLEEEPVFKKVNAPGAQFFGKLFRGIWARNKKEQSTM